MKQKIVYDIDNGKGIVGLYFKYQRTYLYDNYDLKNRKKIIDYGCGSGLLKKEVGTNVFNYDIVLHEKLYKNLSKNYQTALLSHVIEHMSDNELDNLVCWLKKNVEEIIILTPTMNIISKFLTALLRTNSHVDHVRDKNSINKVMADNFVLLKKEVIIFGMIEITQYVNIKKVE
jgi:2-polyprenyl-3-methyl-5-hydroxy-6-metoxy-1,4-benzoquinol methylase